MDTIIEDSDSLQSFLLMPKRRLGKGSKAFLKFHDDKNQAFVISDADATQVIAEARRDAVLFFILAYDQAMVRHRVDEAGWQYWSLEMDAVDPTQTHAQVRMAMQIAHLVEAAGAEPRRRRK